MMEQCAAQMLELLDRPAFLVKDGTIMEANSFARELGIPLARPVAPLLEQWAEAYASYSQGHLALCASSGRAASGDGAPSGAGAGFV